MEHMKRALAFWCYADMAKVRPTCPSILLLRHEVYSSFFFCNAVPCGARCDKEYVVFCCAMLRLNRNHRWVIGSNRCRWLETLAIIYAGLVKVEWVDATEMISVVSILLEIGGAVCRCTWKGTINLQKENCDEHKSGSVLCIHRTVLHEQFFKIKW